MGQDRALQGEGFYRGVAGGVSKARVLSSVNSIYSVESKSSSFAFNIPDSVRRPASSCSIAGAANASLMAFGAWPGLTAKVVEGVKAISRRAAAATNVCDRQCDGNVSHR